MARRCAPSSRSIGHDLRAGAPAIPGTAVATRAGGRLQARAIEDAELVVERRSGVLDHTHSSSMNGLAASPSANTVSMPREVGRVEPRLLARSQQQIDVRPLERLFDFARQRIGRVAAQLPQHDRRRGLEVVERPELEIEQHRDRNGDDDRQARRKPHAAVVQQMAERARLRVLVAPPTLLATGWPERRVLCCGSMPSSAIYAIR